jgi:hypothetical protein
MAADQTSFDLLAHFDQPKTLGPEDPGWVAELERAEPPPAPLVVETPTAEAPRRTAGWVLRCAAALAVLGVAATLLAENAYLLIAEHALASAARAGALEATLPRASYQSIAASVERQLTEYPRLAGRLRFGLVQNGFPVGRRFRAAPGDRLTVMLSAPTSAMLPDWLQAVRIWRGESELRQSADRQTPGRMLYRRPTEAPNGGV